MRKAAGSGVLNSTSTDRCSEAGSSAASIAEKATSDESHLGDYALLCSGLPFGVARSASSGKIIVAKEAIGKSVDLLEEIPLGAWPTPTASAIFGVRNQQGPEAIRSTTFCDACLCVFSCKSPHVRCDVAGCGALFCSGWCASGSMHQALCAGTLGALRKWQAATAINSQYGIEAIARCNVRIAEKVLQYVSTCGLTPAEALPNALRPWERICAFPSDCQLDLRGASAEDVAAMLHQHTRPRLAALLAGGLEDPDAAAAIASELTSVPHVAGLLQRLLLNSFQWAHPREEGLRFGGVFLMMSNANHSCTPNLEIVPQWTHAVEATDVASDHRADDADGSSAGRDACDTLEDGARESCSLMLRTLTDVTDGQELLLSYVDVGLEVAERRRRLQHWGFDCCCERCVQEELDQQQPQGPPTSTTAAAASSTPSSASRGGRGPGNEGSRKRKAAERRDLPAENK